MSTSLARMFGFGLRPDDDADGLPPRGVRRAVALCHSLLTERGEVSGARIAAEMLAVHNALDADTRDDFFDALAEHFSADAEASVAAAEAYRDAPSPKTLAKLQRVTESPRQELFRRLNTVPGATSQLVRLRGQVLQGVPKHPHWEPIADDLSHLFRSWFNPGFLTLQRIDWTSPATVLDKLIQYEAVHAIQGFPDLRRRLEADRRCYAFFHPSMPYEPIIFVEIALTRGLSGKIQPLLDTSTPVLDPAAANAAMFYSITNCHDGLRGIPLGSFLIKQVVDDLQQQLPRIHKFSTLSPVPGFTAWLRKQPCFAQIAPLLEAWDWVADPEKGAKLERLLTPQCARYLLEAKKGREPLDPVARFHLRNGAQLERINWLADVSETGLTNSLGLMVNYVYRPPRIEENHELYTKKFEIAATTAIESLARKAS